MGDFAIVSDEKLGIAANLLRTNDPTLEHLSINAKSDTDLANMLRFILPHISNHLTHLQSVTIDPCGRITSDEIKQEIAQLIDKKIPCLFQIQLYSLPGGICSAITGPLLNNSHLRTLRLRWCWLGDDGAEMLAGVLRHQQCALKELDLDGSGIGDSGCCAIMNALHDNPSLKSLCLNNNEIGMEGCQAIGRALRNKFVTLQELDLGDNENIDDHACSCIANALAENNSLKKLDLCDCSISTGWNAVEQALQKNYTLHQLCYPWYRKKQFRHLLALNRDKPVQAQVTKTGIFPTQLLSSSKQQFFSSDACNAEMLRKVVSYGNLSALFSFIQQCPSFLNSIGHFETISSTK